MNRYINKIVYHCTASQAKADLDVNDVRRMHLKRGWSDIGYHVLIKRDGTIQLGRPFSKVGAHVRGHNNTSIGVVWVGGIDSSGKPEDNRTEKQKESLKIVYDFFNRMYPEAIQCGHRDLSPDKDGDGVVEKHEWLKACPCFDVSELK